MRMVCVGLEYGLYPTDFFPNESGRDFQLPNLLKPLAPVRDLVYRNLGAGRFADLTQASGVGERPGTGLGVVSGDFDGDGLPDVFVANDGMADRLWIQQPSAPGELVFEDRALLAGCALDHSGRAKAGMGVATEDFDDEVPQIFQVRAQVDF